MKYLSFLLGLAIGLTLMPNAPAQISREDHCYSGLGVQFTPALARRGETVPIQVAITDVPPLLSGFSDLKTGLSYP